MAELIHRCNKESDINHIKEALITQSEHIQKMREKLYDGMDINLQRIDKVVDEIHEKMREDKRERYELSKQVAKERIENRRWIIGTVIAAVSVVIAATAVL